MIGNITRWIILISAIIAALACYTAGFRFGASIAIIIGIGFELVFWLTLLRSAHKTKP